MADISTRPFLSHLRGTPTMHVVHVVKGRTRHAGTGRSFWFRPLTAVLSEVPVDDRELPLLFHARTRDFQDVTVQAAVTYRVDDPATSARRLDFGIDPRTGRWRGTPLDQLAGLLAELAQQPAIDLLAGLTVTEAIGGVSAVRERIAAGLAADRRLTDTGITVVGVRVVAIRPEPELERALRTPTREAVQTEADRAADERRALAVERERTIAENELRNRIELARQEQELVARTGANARRLAEEQAVTARITAAAEADREALAADSAAGADRVRAAAEADRLRSVGAARAAADQAASLVWKDVPPATLLAVAVLQGAVTLPEIERLTVTPDLVTDLLGRLAGGR